MVERDNATVKKKDTQILYGVKKWVRENGCLLVLIAITLYPIFYCKSHLILFISTVINIVG